MLDTKDRIDETARMGKGMIDKGADQAAQAGDKAKEAASGMMGAVKEKMHDVADGTTEMIGKATDKAQEWASEIGDAAVHAKDKAKELASSVGDAAVHAKDKAKEMASATADKAGELGKDVTELIRRYPIAALLVGVGAGFLLGQVLHSSSKRS